MQRQLTSAAHSPRATGGLSLAWRLCAALAWLGLGHANLDAFALMGSHWTSTPITMHLQLGPTPAPLLDGSASWGVAAEDALNVWNSNIGAVKFSVVRDSTIAKVDGNNANNVFFSGDVYGDVWGSGVLAVTLISSSGTQQIETDVLFNSLLNWNSYRGAQRYTSIGQGLYDFHRVAMHEFGHVLGLDHPDQNGQSVTALMNSTVSNLDSLAADDINGARSLYGAPATASGTLPAITTQPSSRTVTLGQGVLFIVSATSTSTINYQWTKNGATLGGQTSSSLVFSSAGFADAGNYAVLVSNASGSITSATATLNVLPAPVQPPTIVAQPANQTAIRGANVTFTVGVSGSSPMTYQWRKDSVTLPGATSASLSLGNVQESDAGGYSVAVANSAGSVTSAAATLSVTGPPAITAQPASQTVTAGSSVLFNVGVSGTGPLSYQWSKNTSAIPGATNATFILANAQPSDAASYRVTVTNAAGSLASAPATLSVNVAPTVMLQPASQTVSAGTAVSFNVAATGAPAPRFQWRKDGIDVPGAVDPSYTIPSAGPADAGAYSVLISNDAGSVASGAATLAVNYSRLVNLSTRGFIAPGATLTTGFVVRGTTNKQLVVRAVGPTLDAFGVNAALTTTKLDVIPVGAAAPVVTNAGWAGARDLSNAFASVGAFPLGATSRDSAAETLLPIGGYTVRVAATDPTSSGVALAELYDADAIAAPSRLINASTLGFAGTGENALTPGFVIRGNVPKRLLLRAVGPGLVRFGVPSLLADPQLKIIPSGQLAEIAANDDWRGTDALKTAFLQAGAFALDDASKDAAIVVTLPPGAYSVVISGAGDTTGTALVEIYDLDP